MPAMRPNETEFPWTPKQRRAAVLVAQDTMPDVEIAKEAKIGKATLERWKQHPAFAARVGELVADAVAELRAKGINERQNRLDDYNDLAQRLRSVMEQRAADPKMQRIPGGDTGLMVATPKLVKLYTAPEPNDEDEDDEGETLNVVKGVAQVQYEYAVDTATIKAMLDVRKQAAVETGQWEEKQAHTGGVTIRVEYADAPAERPTPAPPRVRVIEGDS